MISSKQELQRYLRLDKQVNGITKRRPGLYGDNTWKFLIALRHEEYHFSRGGHWHRLCKRFWAMV